MGLSDNSTNRVLSDQRVAEITKRAKNAEAQKSRTTWPSIKDCLVMVKYIKSSEKSGEITLYSEKFKKSRVFLVSEHPTEVGTIFIRPKGVAIGVPCGWFTLDWLEKRLISNQIMVPR